MSCYCCTYSNLWTTDIRNWIWEVGKYASAIILTTLVTNPQLDLTVPEKTIGVFACVLPMMIIWLCAAKGERDARWYLKVAEHEPTRYRFYYLTGIGKFEDIPHVSIKVCLLISLVGLTWFFNKLPRTQDAAVLPISIAFFPFMVCMGCGLISSITFIRNRQNRDLETGPTAATEETPLVLN